MFRRETRCGLSRQAFAVLFGYVLVFHLIITGLAGAVRAAQDFSPQALLDPHALCLSGAESDSPDGDGSGPLDRQHHNLCCTLAYGKALPTSTAFATIAYRAVTATIAHPTSDFGARPSTAPPGLGQGPRAPPSDLV